MGGMQPRWVRVTVVVVVVLLAVALALSVVPSYAAGSVGGWRRTVGSLRSLVPAALPN